MSNAARSSLLPFAAVASFLAWSSPCAVAGTVDWISPVPDDDNAVKQEMIFPEPCSGAGWNGPCTWRAATVAVDAQVTASEGFFLSKVQWKVYNESNVELAGLGGSSASPASPWSKSIKGTLGANLSVSCGKTAKRRFVISATETKPAVPPEQSEERVFEREITLVFTCEKCEPGPVGAGGANQGTTIPARSVPQKAKLQFWILNFLPWDQPFELVVADSFGWPVSLEVPPLIVLQPAESISFWATVEVPPGVPAGLIETLQLMAVPLEGGEPIVIENSLTVVPVLSDLCPGDLNGDGEIDGQDLGAILDGFSSWTIAGDLNGDLLVNIQDLALVLANWGRCDHDCFGAGGNCFVPHSNGGCVDPGCCQAVCGQDVYCCAQVWDELCAGVAVGLCATE